MATFLAGNWALRGTTFVLWALAAASAVSWGLKIGARPASNVAAPVAARSAAPVDPAAVARLLGASPLAATAAPVPTLASRFSLLGVASHPSHSGAALISVDGKPAKPFRVGATVDEGIVLKEVEGRKAVLATASSGEPVLTLELPPPTAATSAALPPPSFPAPSPGLPLPGQRPLPAPVPMAAPR